MDKADELKEMKRSGDLFKKCQKAMFKDEFALRDYMDSSMEVDMRKLLLKHYPAEMVAVMTGDDIPNALQVYYAFVGFLNNEGIVIVPRDKLDEYKKLTIELGETYVCGQHSGD